MTLAHKHTFVILAYKESPHLERCIESLQKQTIPSVLLVSTSTPNDHIHAIARKHSVPILVNRDGGTIGKDWNFAFNSVQTPYVTLAHQDDEYLPDFTKRCLAAVERNSAMRPLFVFNRPAVRIGDSEIASSYKNALRLMFIFPFHFRRSICSTFWKRFILLFSNPISCPGVLYVKANLDGFCFDDTALYVLDWKAWFSLSNRNGAFVYEPVILHVHREHRDSATARMNIEDLQNEELALLGEIWGNQLIPKLLTRLLRFAK